MVGRINLTSKAGFPSAPSSAYLPDPPSFQIVMAAAHAHLVNCFSDRMFYRA